MNTKPLGSEQGQRALVVDDDEIARNLIANYLNKSGYEIIHHENGEEAWEAVRESHFDLIVLDWKLPGLSGLALFNRIRTLEAYRTTPILVVSGFLEKFDFRLLQEFPCTSLMEKPFTKVLFQNRIEELGREKVWYGQNLALIDTLVQAVERDAKKAEALVKQVLKSAPNPIPLALIAARRLVKDRMVKSAEAILRSVLKVDDGCIIAMNELGKALHFQGKHKQAIDVLREANKLSPQNLNRLCLMGEVELNLKDPDSAKAYFAKALSLDADHPVAQSGIVVADNMKSLLSTPSAAHLTLSFASILNTSGIALVRTGQYQKGIDQYRSAMNFLHSSSDAARVAFNLGLGFLRWGKPTDALPWFQRSEKLSPKGFGKSAAYIAVLLERGGVTYPNELPDEAIFANVRETGVDAGAAKKKRGTVHADDESIDNVIPFPAGGKDESEKKKREEDIEDERVGTTHEVVLSGLSLEMGEVGEPEGEKDRVLGLSV